MTGAEGVLHRVRSVGATAPSAARVAPDAGLAVPVLEVVWAVGAGDDDAGRLVSAYRALRSADGADAGRDGPLDLLRVVRAAGGPEGFSLAVGSSDRTWSRSGILKAEAVARIAQVLAGAGVTTVGDLRGRTPDELDAIRARWILVPGQRAGLSWDHLLVVAGIDRLGDGRLERRFVAEALGRRDEDDVTAIEARELLVAAADLAGLDRLGVADGIRRRQGSRRRDALSAACGARPARPRRVLPVTA